MRIESSLAALTGLVLASAPVAVLAEPATSAQDEGYATDFTSGPLEVRTGQGTRAAERGRLGVPVVRGRGSSGRIEVDVWRFPADEGVPEDRTPIFLLHGGPGWRGWNEDQVPYETQVAQYTALADLVVVGQRGIGTSSDMPCSGHSAPIDPGLPREEQMALLVEQLESCRNEWEAEYDVTGFNVIEAAGDVADAARHLGYERIVLVGGSFGSHWSLAVMRYHPELVARAVLHGVEGPDHTYDDPAGLLAALERIAAEAEAAPELEGKLPEEGLIEAWRGVVEAIEREPVEVQVDGRAVAIGPDDIRAVAMGYTTSVRSRRSVGRWPADVVRLVEGHYAQAARAIQRERAMGGLPTASFFLLDCGSGITRERHERYATDPAVALVGDPNWYYDLACPVWEVDLGDDFRTGFGSSIPTVIVHGTWDVSTPLANALELLPAFEDVHFVPVEGGTHGALNEALEHDADFAAAFEAFLTAGGTEALPVSVALPPIVWSATW